MLLRRWDEEKCFDTWKKCTLAKPSFGRRGQGYGVAIENQTRLAICDQCPGRPLALHATLGLDGFNDEKALRKQDKRQVDRTH